MYVLPGVPGADLLVPEGGHDKTRSVEACFAHSQPRMGKGQSPSPPDSAGHGAAIKLGGICYQWLRHGGLLPRGDVNSTLDLTAGLDLII